MLVPNTLARFIAALGLMAAAPLALAQAGTPTVVSAAFTDSSIAGLQGNPRVAITAVVLSFQASTGAKAGPGAFLRMFQSKDEVESVLAQPAMDPALQQALAETAYRQLRADLSAAGYEVVPEAEVLAKPTYQEIVKAAGIANPSRFANAIGDVTLVGPAALKPYLAYSGETGPFATNIKSYLGWSSGFGGKSETPGGPSLIGMSDAWKLPGLEVKLAQELNANVVKAFYVVGLGRTTASRDSSIEANAPVADMTALGGFKSGSYTRTTTGTATAFAQVGLVPDQTRIALRTPTGNAKWQSVSTLSAVPAKDGDVVVRLATPIEGGTAYFDVTGEGSKKESLTSALLSGNLFGGKGAAGKSDINFMFTATLADPEAYAREVAGMLASADTAMVRLLKR